MLKSKLNAVVTVRYNGVDLDITPGELLDVRDFKITSDQIDPVERHIHKVYPNAFENVSRGTQGLTAKELEKSVNDIKASLEACHELRDSLKKTNENLLEENRELRQTVEALEGKIETSRKEIGELKAKLKSKDMPDDKPGHRK